MDFESVAQETGYKAYTTEFDRIIDARDLYTQEQAELTTEQLKTPGVLDYDETSDEQIADLHIAAAEFSDRLKDSLSNLTIDPNETTIGILIDTSGSARHNATTYARAMPLICKIYEDLGFETMVVGHTTKVWNGGETKEKWRADGKPMNPGRLSELAITIYKTPDQKAEDGDHRLATLANWKAYRDNLDGEAAAWMAEHLELNGRSNKVLLYISGDGFPMDDPTLAYNSKDYLEKHTIAVFDEIAANSDITIAPTIANNVKKSFLSDKYHNIPHYEQFDYSNEEEFLTGVTSHITHALRQADAKVAPFPAP